MKPVIQVKGISKCYTINHKDRASYSTIKDDFTHLLTSPFEKKDSTEEKFWALRDINFEVNQGEIFGIIGRNGSGKSTLLKILSRIVEPTKGEIKMHGRVASLLEVGTGFHPELTGRENVYFNGSMLGMSRKEVAAKFNEIVEFAEIEKFIDTPVKFYSSGMYVRLAFAVAAHLDPEILILDEVLAVGDMAFQQKSLAKIKSTMENGTTVLFVSHSMGAVQQLCTKGLLLDGGKVDYLGEVDELTGRYTDIMRDETPQKALRTTWNFSNTKNTPINDYFTIKGISLSKTIGGKKIMSPVESSEEVWVNFDLDIKNPAKDLMIGYAVYSNSRTLLYFSYSGDKPSRNHIKFTKGKTTLSGAIPASLLNEGEYRIAMVSSIHNKFWINEPGSSANPSVQLAIVGGLSHSEYWKSPREGLLAPLIDWKIN